MKYIVILVLLILWVAFNPPEGGIVKSPYPDTPIVKEYKDGTVYEPEPGVRCFSMFYKMGCWKSGPVQ